MQHRLDDIIRQLAAHRQRATYGAVAGVVGRLPIAVMAGRPKCVENSWVVSAATGLPSGYRDGELAEGLVGSAGIVRSPEDLLAWLQHVR